MDKYLSRKWLLTLMVFFATCVFAWNDKMNGDVAMVFSTLIGSYNFGQGIIDYFKEKARLLMPSQNNT